MDEIKIEQISEVDCKKKENDEEICTEEKDRVEEKIDEKIEQPIKRNKLMENIVNRKGLFITLIVLLSILIVFSSYMFVLQESIDKICNIISNYDSNQVELEDINKNLKIIKQSGKLGENIAKDKINAAFVTLFDKNYDFYSSDGIQVNSSVINKYSGYKALAITVGMSQGDEIYTYMIKVTELSKFVKYNSFVKAVSRSQDAYTNAVKALVTGGHYSSVYIKKYYCSLAKSYFQSAANVLEQYSSNIEEYNDYVDEVNNNISQCTRYLNNRNAHYSITAGKEAIKLEAEILDELTDEMEDIITYKKKINSMYPETDYKSNSWLFIVLDAFIALMIFFLLYFKMKNKKNTVEKSSNLYLTDYNVNN